MIDYEEKIVPGQSKFEKLQSEVVELVYHPEQTEENLIGAKNRLFIAPFETKEKIEAFFKNDIVAYKLLISELESNDLKSVFYEIMHNIKTLPSFSDFIKYDGSMYDFILENTIFNNDFKVNEIKFYELMKFICLICYDGHGKSEILLNLFLNNTTLLSRRDLYVDDIHVELKCSKGNISGGMIKGAKQVSHPRIILETIKDCLKDDVDISILDNSTTSGIRGFIDIVNVLRENNVDDELIIYSISNGLFSQFFDLKDNLQFNMFIRHIKFNHDELASQLYRIHGVLAIISYQLSDNWKYLCVCDAISGKYTIIEALDIKDIKDVNWKDFMKLYNNDKIIFKNGPSTTAKDERGYVSTIYCV